MAYLPVPYANVNLVDILTGLPTKEWYDVLKQIDGLDPLSKIPAEGPEVSSIDTATGDFTIAYPLQRSSQKLLAALSSGFAALGANVGLTSGWTDGPSISGLSTSGTYLATATLVILDTTLSGIISGRIADNATNVYASSSSFSNNTSKGYGFSISAIVANPSGGIIKVQGISNNNTGTMLFNQSGNSKDCHLAVVRIA